MGHWLLGITGQHGNSNASVSNALGFGHIASEGNGLGLTATWHGNNGTYFDAQGQVNWISSDISSSTGGALAANQNSTAYALSAEAGHRFRVSETGTLVPQAQLVWGQVDGASFTDSAGNAVNLGSNNNIVARLGLAYEYETLTAAGNSQKLYAIANILHDFSGSNSVNVAGAKLSSHTSATWGELGLGGSVALGAGKSLYGEASYRQAFGNSHSNALAANVGLRIQW
ncbi:autotransporter outer membrane beta-barrel domain-containing protein [Ahrensia kielensis]|uniref:Autotransporter outer membrane beta-barrel domain-containing protein n=1 Tax=Ahrensia kielensis TaxID=76980 RepID=A0ABU9T450_9HYPH